MLGKGKLAWDTWPNHLVGRPSLQSGNETNDLLKSGPALAGPARPATPPLLPVYVVLIKTPTGKIYKVVLAYISVVFSLFQHILEAYPIPFTKIISVLYWE